MRFSRLATHFQGSKNRLYLRRDELLAQGRQIVDLISGNMNEYGIVFPQGLLRDILSEATEKATIYRPDSFGQPSARAAIAAHSPSGITADSILLTPGSSIAYWYCFKILCEDSDEVLCPAPSYPLFDYIATMSGVRMRHYRLDESNNWAIDFEHLEGEITGKTRAIITISPHNPTGMVSDSLQMGRLSEIAQRRELAIISDEVFSHFVFEGEGAWAAATGGPLVFTLNGFSKMFALPGVKIGWMGISGERDLVKKALTTLEMISDTFLPVNEIAQFAVPAIFEQGQRFLKDSWNQIKKRRDSALSALEGLNFVPPRGGFYMVLSYERDIEDEDLAIQLLEKENILVHPGYLYDIEGQHLVCSYAQPLDVVKDSFPRLKSHL